MMIFGQIDRAGPWPHYKKNHEKCTGISERFLQKRVDGKNDAETKTNEKINAYFPYNQTRDKSYASCQSLRYSCQYNQKIGGTRCQP